MNTIDCLNDLTIPVQNRIFIAGSALLRIAVEKGQRPDPNYKKRQYSFRMLDGSPIDVRPLKVEAGDEAHNRKPLFSNDPTMLRGQYSSQNSFYYRNAHVTLEVGRPINPLHVWTTRNEQGATMINEAWLPHQELIIDFITTQV